MEKVKFFIAHNLPVFLILPVRSQVFLLVVCNTTKLKFVFKIQTGIPMQVTKRK